LGLNQAEEVCPREDPASAQEVVIPMFWAEPLLMSGSHHSTVLLIFPKPHLYCPCPVVPSAAKRKHLTKSTYMLKQFHEVHQSILKNNFLLNQSSKFNELRTLSLKTKILTFCESLGSASTSNGIFSSSTPKFSVSISLLCYFTGELLAHRGFFYKGLLVIKVFLVYKSFLVGEVGKEVSK
jgi:hypothetical protein